MIHSEYTQTKSIHTNPILKYIAQLPESLENTPMGDELKWLLKEGGGHIFESGDISLENMPTVSLALFYVGMHDPAMPLLSCARLLCNNSKWCLSSFVSPSSGILALLQCFLLNITTCTVA